MKIRITECIPKGINLNREPYVAEIEVAGNVYDVSENDIRNVPWIKAKILLMDEKVKITCPVTFLAPLGFIKIGGLAVATFTIVNGSQDA